MLIGGYHEATQLPQRVFGGWPERWERNGKPAGDARPRSAPGFFDGQTRWPPRSRELLGARRDVIDVGRFGQPRSVPRYGLQTHPTKKPDWRAAT